MRLLTRISALGLLAATVVGGSCLSASNSGGGLGGNTKSSLGLFLENLTWGRLVDVRDSSGILVESDVLINHLIESDGVNFSITNNPVNQKETLTILRTAGSASFIALLSTAESNLEPIVDKAATSAPPFTELARNATVRLQFSEQIDPSSVDFTTVQVFTGNPPLLGFTGRYIVKNDAGLDKGFVFFDTTVSATEAAAEFIPQNAVGLPASPDSVNANFAIRIPTQPDPLIGQPKVLRSLNGKLTPSVQDLATEPFETTGVSNTLVRAARTGNNLDDFNGFLLDNTPPSLLAVKNATINTISSVTGSVVDFLYTIDLAVCKPMTPKVGDIFEVGAGLLLVTDVLNSGDPNNFSVRATLEAAEGSIVAGATSLSARYTTAYTPQDALVQACYLEFQPPIAQLSGAGIIDISDASSVTIRFDEPINTGSMRSMSTFVIVNPDAAAVGGINEDVEIEAAWYRQVNTSETTADFIDRQRGYDFRAITAGADALSEFSGRLCFGPIEATDGNRQFSLTPSFGWVSPSTSGAGEAYVVALRGGVTGILDLSGNPLAVEGFVAGNGQAGESNEQDVKLVVNHDTFGSLGNYLFWNGNSLDENGDGQAEWAGNLQLMPNGLTGRFPSRFSRAADSSSPAMSNRLLGTPVTEPLNPAGAVVMSAFRPQEFGFSYGDATEYNMTVEGFNWSPNAGVVFDESFEDISLSLSTAGFLPDEFLIPPPNQIVMFPESGLTISGFDDNILGFTLDGSSGIDEIEVFRNKYVANGIELFTNNGTPYMPWPDFTANYVWRDTAIPQTFLGTHVNSAGAPNQQYVTDNTIIFGWAPEAAPSVSLPLLARFRVFPQSNRLGFNSFSVTQMIPNRSPMVNFRIWSSGGQDGSGIWHQIQPDNSALGGTRPIGGFVPGTGNRTDLVGDDHIYWTQADFVVDTSRIYSHWFDLGSVLLLEQVSGVVVEPANESQPVGTSIVVEFRGSALVTHGADPDVNPSPLTNADTQLDAHGDFIGGFGSVSTPSLWTTDLTELEGNGFRYIQVRVTFKSNADLGLRPELDSLGIIWSDVQP
ncbi:MAG: hypothetical protein O3A50_02510 [Planctomycetota bacterium]|nr:hypothetical protein [Planctomycetota bacterium]